MRRRRARAVHLLVHDRRREHLRAGAALVRRRTRRVLSAVSKPHLRLRLRLLLLRRLGLLLWLRLR